MKFVKRTLYALVPAILLVSMNTIHAEACLETLQEDISSKLSASPELQARYMAIMVEVNKVLANMFNMRYNMLIKHAEEHINKDFAKFVQEVSSTGNNNLAQVRQQLNCLLNDLKNLVNLLKQYVGRKGFAPAFDLSVKLAQFEAIAPASLQKMVKTNPFEVRRKVQALLERQ